MHAPRSTHQSPLPRPRPFGMKRPAKPSKMNTVSSRGLKKSVSFSTGKDKIHTIPDLSDVRSLVWFSADETYDSKSEATQVAEALEAMSLAGKHEDWRGLESRGPEGRWMAYKARMDNSNAVLDAQDERLDAILLAKASREISNDSIAQAIERAQKDAVEAKEYCKRVQTMRRKPICPVQTMRTRSEPARRRRGREPAQWQTL